MDARETPQVIRRRNPADPRTTDIRVLRALRDAGYRDLAQLGRELGLRQEGVSRILHGEIHEKARRIFKELAAKLEISVDELLELMEQARVNPLYLHPTDALDYILASVDGLSVLIPNKSA